MPSADRETPLGELLGGIANIGAVARHGDEVHRPAGPHAAAIHQLLRLARDRGFEGAPRPLALSGGHERLEYIHGDVPVAPFPTWWKTNRALAATAAPLRRFHDISVGLNVLALQWSTELIDPQGGEVIRLSPSRDRTRDAEPRPPLPIPPQADEPPTETTGDSLKSAPRRAAVQRWDNRLDLA